MPETNAFGAELVSEWGGDGFLEGVLTHAELDSDAVETLVIADIYHDEVYKAIQTRWSNLDFVALTLPPAMRRDFLETEHGLAPKELYVIEGAELDKGAERLIELYKPTVLEGHSNESFDERVAKLSSILAA